jgi:hypothetical protein
MSALMEHFARLYSRAPNMSSDAVPAWRELARQCNTAAVTLRREYAVTEVVEPTPYHTAHQMFRDLDDGRILVSRANSEHPVWTVQDNVNFRLCHDVLGHYTAHNAGDFADFSWEGELAAFAWQERSLFGDDVRRALLTEVVGQAAYALHFGNFGTQAVAFL